MHTKLPKSKMADTFYILTVKTFVRNLDCLVWILFFKSIRTRNMFPQLVFFLFNLFDISKNCQNPRWRTIFYLRLLNVWVILVYLKLILAQLISPENTITHQYLTMNTRIYCHEWHWQQTSFTYKYKIMCSRFHHEPIYTVWSGTIGNESVRHICVENEGSLCFSDSWYSTRAIL